MAGMATAIAAKARARVAVTEPAMGIAGATGTTGPELSTPL